MKFKYSLQFFLKTDPLLVFPGNFPEFSGQQILIVNSIVKMEGWCTTNYKVFRYEIFDKYKLAYALWKLQLTFELTLIYFRWRVESAPHNQTWLFSVHLTNLNSTKTKKRKTKRQNISFTKDSPKKILFSIFFPF